MARFTNRFSTGAPPQATADLERELIELMEPAAQRAAIDLYLLTHKRPGQNHIQRDDFYEVTFVQFLYQYMLMSHAFAGLDLLWEVPYNPTGGRGHPLQVDIEIRQPANAAQPWERMLVELGLFETKKVKTDSEKLRDLQHHGQAINGEKRVLLYWLGSTAPKTAAAVRSEVRRRQRHKQNLARMGTNRVKPIWVRGFELYTPASTAGTQFSAVMFEVLP